METTLVDPGQAISKLSKVTEIDNAFLLSFLVIKTAMIFDHYEG